MFNTNVYDYVNVLNKAADAAWMRNELMSNNIANVDTPDFKRQDIRFETELKSAIAGSKEKTVDAKVRHLDLDGLSPQAYTDYSTLSYRYDGNNVDIDTENVMLAENQIKYDALMTSVNQEFSNLKTAMKG